MSCRGFMRAAAFVVGVTFSIGTAMAETEVVAEGLKFPEGPLLVNGVPYWVEYSGNVLMKLENSEKIVVYSQDDCGHNGLARSPGGGFALVCYESSEVLYLDDEGNVLERIDRDSNGEPFDHPNDIAFAADGGAYLSISGPFIANPEIVGGVAYRAPGESTFTMVADDIHYANGLMVSQDQKSLLVSEHITNRILQFDINEDGSLGRRRVFARMTDLVTDGEQPSHWLGIDGMKRDSAGNIYAAHYLGKRVVKLSPDGRLLASYDIPALGVTNVELDEDGGYLYVTAAEDLVNAPYLGKLWRMPLE